MGYKSNDSVPIRKGHTGIQERRSYEEGAGIGVMQPQARECQEPSEPRRGMKEFSPRAFQGGRTLPTPWLHTSGLQNRENIFLLFWAPQLWWFEAAAPGSYNIPTCSVSLTPAGTHWWKCCASLPRPGVPPPHRHPQLANLLPFPPGSDSLLPPHWAWDGKRQQHSEPSFYTRPESLSPQHKGPFKGGKNTFHLIHTTRKCAFT